MQENATGYSVQMDSGHLLLIVLPCRRTSAAISDAAPAGAASSVLPCALAAAQALFRPPACAALLLVAVQGSL